jgi:hypothetical protein
MLLSRTAWKLALAVLTSSTSCAFEDPNAPPPQDHCIDANAGAAVRGLWARIDGPAGCGQTAPPSVDEDTIAFFTGSKWGEASSLCRARDLFLGEATVYNADCANAVDPRKLCEPVKIEAGGSLPVAAPPEAIGYCLINKGTASEVVAYSVCGVQTAGEDACEHTLTRNADITAEWLNCPGAPLCPLPPDDVCLKGSSDKSGYVGYVDNPAYSCDANSPLADHQDSMFVSTSTGYNPQMAVCMASTTYDAAGGLSFGHGAVVRYMPQNPPPGLPHIDAGDPTPAGAKGYCLIHQDTVFEFALFSLCDETLVPATDADSGVTEPVPAVLCEPGTPPRSDTGCLCREDEPVTAEDRCIRTPKQACEHGEARVLKPRLGTWLACPGSPYCPS